MPRMYVRALSKGLRTDFSDARSSGLRGEAVKAEAPRKRRDVHGERYFSHGGSSWRGDSQRVHEFTGVRAAVSRWISSRIPGLLRCERNRLRGGFGLELTPSESECWQRRSHRGRARTTRCTMAINCSRLRGSTRMNFHPSSEFCTRRV